MNLSLINLCWSVFPVQVSVGPFTIVKSIDRLIEALADMLSAERRGFTLSTKNIGEINILKTTRKISIRFKYRRSHSLIFCLQYFLTLLTLDVMFLEIASGSIVYLSLGYSVVLSVLHYFIA